MANGWSLIIGLIVIAVASVVAWIFSPKGENQTNYVFGAVASAYFAEEGGY
ncbi:hypothetical protein BDV36DRAFT_296220 [Aspergillus pseudocaelatus]|uniref:Uncharacterized protein n=1 Tax=Aspergillus pseudocaelatus TaxID=1825620 RepID=A0ABQ6WJU3_9EURO|nr:hypothetical protein BDV36DRAFT_296220 [Aspergillus pseudocaelatus]